AESLGQMLSQALSAPEVSEDEYPYMCSFGSDGSQAQALYISDSTQQVVMDGAEVYMAAVDAMSEEITYVLDSCGIDPERIDQLVCHQANGRIMAAVARRLRWDSSKVLSYIDRYGNTSAASIPITLAVGQQEGHVKPGDLLALTAFGAGFTWGAGVIGFKTTA
ncbi:MAG: 3-oxoacyl-[acyl-carrier-protein] synthase III C-terminal domain-containing protein, partial [Rothia dentocariosa]